MSCKQIVGIAFLVLALVLVFTGYLWFRVTGNQVDGLLELIGGNMWRADPGMRELAGMVFEAVHRKESGIGHSWCVTGAVVGVAGFGLLAWPERRGKERG